MDKNKVDLAWCLDILRRIQEVLDNELYEDRHKIYSASWLVKQGLAGHERN